MRLESFEASFREELTMPIKGANLGAINDSSAIVDMIAM